MPALGIGFLFSMMEGTLGLTQDERKTLEAAIPTLIEVVVAFNAIQPDLVNANSFWADGRTQAVITKALAGGKVLGPNLQALLSDGMVDIGGTMSVVKDVQQVLAANPGVQAQAVNYYNKLRPFIDKLVADWPKVKPAYEAVVAAQRRKG